VEVSRTALVTGASSGLGRAFAELLASRGYDLILIARREAELAAVADGAPAGVQVETVPLDLAADQRGADLDACLAGREIDFLVNAAGTGAFGPFAGAGWDRTRATIELNVTAYTRVLHAVVPAMVARGTGRILNVASVASFQPGPLMSVYYASKAYALSLSEALAEELAHHGVTVTALCPGPLRSAFHAEAGMHIPERDTRKMPSAEQVAAFGYRAAVRGRRVAVYGVGFRLMVFAERLLPRRLVAGLVYRMQRRRHPGA
jgi:hypothetical protein